MKTSTSSASHGKSSMHKSSTTQQSVETEATEVVILDDELQSFLIPAVKLNEPKLELNKRDMRNKRGW